jgi:hypothetical protein
MRWLGFSLIATSAVLVACGGSASPAAPSTTTTTTTTPAAAATWNAEGVRMTNLTAGFPNSVLANPSVFRLNDGRYRMLVTGGTDPSGILSAVSSDGLSWTFESGRRVQTSGDCGHVRAFRLDDGRVRVYCRNPSGILAYISSDEGQTMTSETGLMITNAQAGSPRLSTGGIVRTKDGRWRMYFSDESTGAPPGPMKIFSAVSTDLLSWTVEPGVRIGSGATASGSATHPSAILNADGSVSVAYTRFSYAGSSDPTISAVWIATSSDGLTFTRDESTKLTPGADADIVSMNGTIRVYYNWGDNTNGTIYSATLSGTLAPATFGFIR